MEVYVLVRTNDGSEVLGAYSTLSKAMQNAPMADEILWDEHCGVYEGKMPWVYWHRDGERDESQYYRIEKHTVDTNSQEDKDENRG